MFMMYSVTYYLELRKVMASYYRFCVLPKMIK